MKLSYSNPDKTYVHVELDDGQQFDVPVDERNQHFHRFVKPYIDRIANYEGQVLAPSAGEP